MFGPVCWTTLTTTVSDATSPKFPVSPAWPITIHVIFASPYLLGVYWKDAPVCPATCSPLTTHVYFSLLWLRVASSGTYVIVMDAVPRLSDWTMKFAGLVPPPD